MHKKVTCSSLLQTISVSSLLGTREILIAFYYKTYGKNSTTEISLPYSLTMAVVSRYDIVYYYI